MILMPQIFDVTANENAHYKRNELEYNYVLFTERSQSGCRVYVTEAKMDITL